MRHKKIWLFFAILSIIILGLLFAQPPQIAVINSGSQRYIDPIFSSVNVTTNVGYGSARMDIYEPSGDTAQNRAAIIWIHGGGFGGGDKDLFSSTGNDFANIYAKYGYVGFSINYRLDTRVHSWADSGMKSAIDKAVADTYTAIKYILAHPEYRIDPHRIILAGSSAGAITSLYAAYSSPPTPIAAIVSMAGGLLPEDLNLATSNSSPTIILHGEHDKVVPVDVAQQLDAQLTRVGAIHELHILPSVSHNVLGQSNIHDFILPFLAKQIVIPIESPVTTPLSPSPHSTPEPTLTPTLEPSPSPTPTPTQTPTPDPSPLPTPRATFSPLPSPSQEPSPLPTLSPSPMLKATYPPAPPKTSFIPTTPTPTISPYEVPSKPGFWARLWQTILRFFSL